MTMTTSYEKVFYREFKEMMNARKAHITGFSLNSIPLPSFHQESTLKTKFYVGTKTRKLALVKGVSEPFFERLNNTEVELLGRTKLYKRQVLSDGSFRKDKDGNYVVDEVTVPNTSVGVLSPISIGLKRFIEDERGKKKEHKPSEGYRYVDYVETKEGRKYIYIVPKQFVYRLSLVALIITHNRHKNYYHGVRVALQNGHYVYVYTVPYTYRENSGSLVIGVKASTDFNNEVKRLFDFWQRNGIMFPIESTRLTDQLNGITNLGFQEVEGTLTPGDYKRYHQSLAEEGVDRLEDDV